MVSPVGLSHIECGLARTLSVPQAAMKRKLTLSNGSRKELKYQNTNSSKISRRFKESVTLVCFLGLPSVKAGPNHSHFETLMSCRT